MVISLPDPLNSLRFVNTTLYWQSQNSTQMYGCGWCMLSCQEEEFLSTCWQLPCLNHPVSCWPYHCKVALLNHVQLAGFWEPKVSFFRAAPWPGDASSSAGCTRLVHARCWARICFYWTCEVLTVTFLQPVKDSVSDSLALQCISHSHHIGQFLLHCQGVAHPAPWSCACAAFCIPDSVFWCD